MDPMRPLLVAVAVVAITACSDDGATPASTTPPVPPIPAVSTTTAATTPSASASTTTAPATPSTSPTASPPDSTITGAEVAGAVDAGAATIWGLHLFAERPIDDVVAVVDDRLGTPTSDTGLLDMSAEFECTGNDAYRVVRWGDLRLTFTHDEADDTSVEPRERMIAWTVGDDRAVELAPSDPPPTAAAPTGITTVDGIGIGSRRDDLRAAFTDDEVLAGFDGEYISVYRPSNGGAPTATLFLLEDDEVIGFGAGPPDCIDSGDL